MNASWYALVSSTGVAWNVVISAHRAVCTAPSVALWPSARTLALTWMKNLHAVTFRAPLPQNRGTSFPSWKTWIGCEQRSPIGSSFAGGRICLATGTPTGLGDGLALPIGLGEGEGLGLA